MVRKSSPTKRATLEDVARAAGVGPMTVSRTINGHPYVAPGDSEDEFGRLFAQLDYRPNHAARMLTGQLSRSIGLIVPDIADYFLFRDHPCRSGNGPRKRLPCVVGRVRTTIHRSRPHKWRR